MTKQELTEKMSASFEELKPLVQVLANALCDAHKKGFFKGIEIGAGIKLADDSLDEDNGVDFNINFKR